MISNLATPSWIIQPDKQSQTGGLMLSSRHIAEDLAQLQKEGVRAVVSVCIHDQLQHLSDNKIAHLHIKIDDEPNVDIAQYFQATYEFIENHRKTTNVLVHCMAGVSRSATIVMAYLMKEKQMSSKEAFDYVFERRCIVYPNDGFLQQLSAYKPAKNKISTSSSCALF